MPVAKLKASNTKDVMKPEEGNDSPDTIVAQAIGTGKDSFLHYFRANDSSAQWIQLLHALDQQDLPGWPLLSPLKVQMRKCEKCSKEFCSAINYRRHIRVQHRLKKLDKDSTKKRDLLGAFWDKLSEDEAKEILSFKDVALEEVPGSLIIKSLTTLIRKPGISSPPYYCLEAGSALLDIIQASRFPFPSEQLFSILDDASEKTFLCGPAIPMPKYIFDGEAGKICLETKNLVACTSFLVEQELIKAWLANKDAEALRCQKLLVEEEEAAHRRQAALLERKRQKKLRQKAKERRQDAKAGVKECIDDTLEAQHPAMQYCSLAISDSDNHGPVTLPVDIISSLEPSQPLKTEDVDLEIQSGSGSGYTDLDNGHDVEQWMVKGNSRGHIVARRNISQRNYLSKELRQDEKAGVKECIGNTVEADFKERIDDTLEAQHPAMQSCSLAISDSDNHGPVTLPVDIISSLEPSQPLKTEDVDLEIQSGSGSAYTDLDTDHNFIRKMAQGNSQRHIVVARQNIPSKSPWNHQNSLAPKLSTIQHAIHRDSKPMAVVNIRKKWNQKSKPENKKKSLKTISQKEAMGQLGHSKKQELLIGSISVTLEDNLDGTLDDCPAEDQMPTRINFQENCNRPDFVQCGTYQSTVKLWRPVSQNGTNGPMLIEDEVDRIAGKDENFGGVGNSSLLEVNLHPGSLHFSSQVAKAFLEERWKEAIAAEHLELILSPDFEPPGSMGVQNDCQVAAAQSSLDITKHNILSNAENQLVDVSAHVSSTVGAGKTGFRRKPKKVAKLNYIPKQTSIT